VAGQELFETWPVMYSPVKRLAQRAKTSLGGFSSPSIS
jgi:hypothetical protein